jgi:GNAT superfamily N-acetyltransferase
VIMQRSGILMVDTISRNGGSMPCIQRMEFDSEAFRLPFYRVRQLDEKLLSVAIEKLIAAPGPLAIDAKIAADDIPSAQLLMNLGFRKICTQFTLTHPLSETPPASEAAIDRTLLLDESTIWQHARNFRYDRFSLDPLLPTDGRQCLYFKWIINSLTLGKKLIAHLGQDFCSFSAGPEGVVIDLVSILRPRQGTGTKLVDAIIGYAQSHGFERVKVTTECENKPAWNLYLGRGFQVSGFVSVFHFLKPVPSQGEQAG